MVAQKKCKGCWVIVVGFMLGAANVVWAQNQSKELSINLKARSLVIGPQILLHEICFIQTDSREVRQKIGAVQLGKAPPPGESKELTLSFIKLQLRQAGLQKYLDRISGPKVIRVTTAHQEISKAVLEDAVTEYVRLHAPGVDFRVEQLLSPDFTATTRMAPAVAIFQALKQAGAYLSSCDARSACRCEPRRFLRFLDEVGATPEIQS